MKDFLFVYRNNPGGMSAASPEEMQAMTKKWMDWIGSIAAQNKLADRGNRLVNDGNVLKAGGVITDGPYMETKELLSGYSLVKAETLEEAVEIAKGCPIFLVDGTVEVRQIDVI